MQTYVTPSKSHSLLQTSQTFETLSASGTQHGQKLDATKDTKAQVAGDSTTFLPTAQLDMGFIANCKTKNEALHPPLTNDWAYACSAQTPLM